MNQEALSAIRREVFILYAESHPDVRLEDIAVALGYDPKEAEATATHFVETAGLRNPVNVRVVYEEVGLHVVVPRERRKRVYVSAKDFDLNRVRELLKENREFSYLDVSDIIDCSCSEASV